MLSCTFSVWRIIIIELVACVNCRDYDIPTNDHQNIIDLYGKKLQFI